jgi:mRNA interferase RelE/StbE
MPTRSPLQCVRVNKVPESSRYQLAITATARRQLAKSLPTSVAFAAYEFISGPLLENPQRVGKQLMAPLDDRHSARRGTYRVIYRIDDQQMTVTVLAVSARSDAYRSP